MKYTLTIIAALMIAGLLTTLSPDASYAFLDGGTVGGAEAAKGQGQPLDLTGNGGVFQTVTNVLLYVIGAISVIMIVIGGLRYVLSGGDAKNVEAAKNTILYAIIGIVVALLAYAAVNFVVTSFSAGGGVFGGGDGAGPGI